MKKGFLFLLILSFLSGCEKTNGSSLDTTAEVMDHLVFSALDYNLNSNTESFIVLGVENTLDQPIQNANFYLSLHKEGESNSVSPNPFYFITTGEKIGCPGGREDRN